MKQLKLQERFNAPTPKPYRIASLVFKGIAIAAMAVLPPLGIITLAVGTSIATAAMIASTACSFTHKKDALDVVEEVLDGISNVQSTKNQ